MSKAQGDGFRTWTNKGLNNYYDNVFLPKFVELEDKKIKEYHINGGKIVCESKNVVTSIGWKLHSLKVTGEKEYIVRVFPDETDSCAVATKGFTDKDKANEYFKLWKEQLQH